MDSDDISLNLRIEKQVEFLNLNPNISVVGTNASYINENNLYLFNSSFPLNHYEIKKALVYKNVFNHSSIMMRKSFLEKMNFIIPIIKSAKIMSFGYEECTSMNMQI